MTPTTIRRARELPETDRATARANAEVEYRALAEFVAALTPDEWGRPTDCTGWTVRHMVAHLAGAAQGCARPSVALRHNVKATVGALRGPLTPVDYLCASQIADRAALSDGEVGRDLQQWAALAPGGIAATPGFVLRQRLPRFAGLRPGATLRYLFDTIYTRDVWLHRVDLARATGRPRAVSAADTEVVAQVIRDLDLEWDGPAVDLTLTGPGGGSWTIGEGAPVVHVREDGVAFMRLLSGRSDECRLDAEGDPAAVAALRRARVVF